MAETENSNLKYFEHGLKIFQACAFKTDFNLLIYVVSIFKRALKSNKTLKLTNQLYFLDQKLYILRLKPFDATSVSA